MFHSLKDKFSHVQKMSDPLKTEFNMHKRNHRKCVSIIHK